MQDSVQAGSARDFAEQWVANWNRKDLEAVLKFFSDDVKFLSPRAESIISSSRLAGKAKLREYWARAILRNSDHSL
jgi:steroid delta-isomerase